MARLHQVRGTSFSGGRLGRRVARLAAVAAIAVTFAACDTTPLLLRGTVTTEAGSRAGGVPVVVYADDAETVVAQTTTDMFGGFQFRRSSLPDGTYRIRQDPGESNALGRVKFVMPNDMAIYLHDTPSRGLFRRARRAFSHGCIRVESPETLAGRLLGDTGRWSDDTIRQAIDSGKRTIAGLRQPVPVVIFYVTTTVDADGSVRFYPDVYGYDQDALASLRSARQLALRKSD